MDAMVKNKMNRYKLTSPYNDCEIIFTYGNANWIDTDMPVEIELNILWINDENQLPPYIKDIEDIEDYVLENYDLWINLEEHYDA
jgi:hypothetical protein